MLSVLESLNSGPSTLHASQLRLPSPPVRQPCVCLSPCSLHQSPTQRLFVIFVSSAVPRVFTIRFIRQTDVCPLTPHPSSAIDPTSSAHVRRSRTHQPRDRPSPQSSSATTRAPSNITSPPRHSHRHPDPHPARISAPILSADSALTAPTRLSPSTFVNPAPAMCFRLPTSHSLAPDRDPQRGAKGCAAPPVARCTSSWPYAIVQAPQKSPQASARAPPILRDPPMGAASPERPPRPRARRRARWPPRARPPCL